MYTPCPTDRSQEIADRVEAFVRDIVIPYEQDALAMAHGPSNKLVLTLRDEARAAGLMTPHILDNVELLTHLQTADVFKRSGLLPLGPIEINIFAPNEGNMFLLGKVANAD